MDMVSAITFKRIDSKREECGFVEVQKGRERNQPWQMRAGKGTTDVIPSNVLYAGSISK